MYRKTSAGPILSENESYSRTYIHESQGRLIYETRCDPIKLMLSALKMWEQAAAEFTHIIKVRNDDVHGIFRYEFVKRVDVA